MTSDTKKLLAKYQTLLHHSKMGMWEIDSTQKNIFIDPGLTQILGLKANTNSNYLVSDFLELFYPSDAKIFRAYLESDEDFDSPVEMRLRIQMKSKEPRYIRSRAIKMRNTEGTLMLISGMAWEATSEVLRKKELNKSKIFLERIMDAIPDPVFAKDKDRDIAEKNKLDSQFRLMISLIDSSGDLFGFTDNFGVTVYVNKTGQDILGIQTGKKHFADYLSPHDRQNFLDDILPNLRNSESWQGEITIISSLSGEEIPVWLQIFSVPVGPESSDVFYAYTGSDLRKLKQIQNSLIGQSKMAALGEMAAEIAHEINNPLAIIQGKSQLIQEKLSMGLMDNEKLQKDLELIERNGHRIQKIINSSKALARKSEKDPYEFFSIAKIVEESFEICRERFQKHHKSLSFEITSKIDYTDLVEVRSTEIIQVLVNLLSNSFDAIQNQQAGWVKIKLSRVNLHYQIEIIDSGEKIPKDIADKMMAPFFTTKPTGQGTGLGLSLSKQIAEAHGGQFFYDPKSSYTRFVFRLKCLPKN
ncbi:MAG: hypothetical protein A3D17_07560 [Bdellovibrionales bacterium RIFCSPHIGHO2_02_FULL_40_15]|nr:MAG: hypothetical protein A3D17_07560 [Bdellovibrionales bacterium RIFCSPHIGHO2_02_FULL_40_15]